MVCSRKTTQASRVPTFDTTSLKDTLTRIYTVESPVVRFGQSSEMHSQTDRGSWLRFSLSLDFSICSLLIAPPAKKRGDYPCAESKIYGDTGASSRVVVH